MRYPVVIHQEGDSAYGVTVPDIAGCFSAGDTLDEALHQVQEAIISHLSILAEDGISAPAASSVAVYKDHPDYKDGIWALVEVDVTPFLGKSEKINVTLPSFLIKQIDEAVAAGFGKSRSGFLADSALKHLKSAWFSY